MKTSLQILSLLALTQQANTKKCPFGFGGDDDIKNETTKQHHHPKVQAGELYPSEILTCPSSKTKVLTTISSFSNTDYETISADVYALFDGMSSTSQTNFAACILRLAGHDFMDYRNNFGTESGGSDGCVNFNDADNTGLATCITTSTVSTIYQTYCDKVSLADFIVIAAEALMARTATDYNSAAPFTAGTLATKYRNRFKAGRTTQETCPDNHGLMPDANAGCSHLEEIFVNHVYAGNGNDNAWKLTAAISGAHTLGSAKTENSGFNGHWSTAAEQGKFNNDYYKSLILKGWGPELAIGGNSNKDQWKRIDDDTEQNNHHEIMLNSDMCLAYKNNNDGYLKAADRSCCGWIRTETLFDKGVMTSTLNNDYCGTSFTSQNQGDRQACCREEVRSGGRGGNNNDCDSARRPDGPAIDSIYSFAASESAFIDSYTEAWWRATENGFVESTRTFDSATGLTMQKLSLALAMTLFTIY